MSSAPNGDLSYAQAVSSWTAHLRTGGTTPWATWRPDPGETGALEVIHPLPDALHLELVRRINLAATPQTGFPDGPPAGLADRVLDTAAPGRGLLDVPLTWPTAVPRFGTPPHDPGQLPDEELVRLGVGVLAHLLPGVPTPALPVRRSRWPTPWRRRFRLHGPPATVAAVRQVLTAQGLVETDWRPTHLVIARPVEVMMAEHWSAAVREGGILKWSAVWRRAEAAGRLPPPIDVAAIAAGLDGRRREPLHVVVAQEAQDVVRLCTAVLRARPAEVRGTGDAAVSDLLRRLNRLTALTHGPAQVRDLARTLVSVLEEDTADPARISVPVAPPAALGWAREAATTSADRIRRAGYAVHGNLDDLVPREHAESGTIDREHTLELAVTACLRTWQLGGQS